MPTTTVFKRFDLAEHLKTEEEIADYLEAAGKENDAALMVKALGTVARARNMAQLARESDITREGLYKALSPDGNPSFATVSKIAKALGFRLAIVPISEAPSS